MKKIICTTALALIASSNAFAINKGGVFIEPMITYEKGEGDVNFPAPINSSESDIDGFGAGLRFGVHVLDSVFLGVDGRYSIPKWENTTLNQDIDTKAWNYGPVLGVQMPTAFGLRLWGGYIYDATLDPDSDQSVDTKFKDGDGWRAGAGVKLAFASLNVEYQNIKYDTTELEGGGVFAPGTAFNNINLENKSWLLSVSFPMSL